MANQKKGKYFEEPMRTQGKKKRQKRVKTRATKSSMVLVLHLIGWESGASFLD